MTDSLSVIIGKMYGMLYDFDQERCWVWGTRNFIASVLGNISWVLQCLVTYGLEFREQGTSLEVFYLKWINYGLVMPVMLLKVMHWCPLPSSMSSNLSSKGIWFSFVRRYRKKISTTFALPAARNYLSIGILSLHIMKSLYLIVAWYS